MRADRLAEQVLPDEEARAARDGDARLDDEVGERQRVQRPAAAVRPARPAAARAARPVGVGLEAGVAVAAAPGGHVAHRLAHGGDVLRAGAAAAADELRALLAPAAGQPRVLLPADPGVAPAVVREVAEVGIDAERQVGEVAQVRDHAVDVVGRDAVDQQRPHAELLEAERRAAERVALRAAPVLRRRRRTGRGGSGGSSATPAGRWRAAPRPSRRASRARAPASRPGSRRAGPRRTAARGAGSSPRRRASRRPR